MNFGPPLLTSPYYYYVVLPSQYFLSLNQISSQQDSFKQQLQTSEQNLHKPEKQKQIIITREDLMEEGYDQLKKPWTEEQDQLLKKLCANPSALFEDIAPFLPGRNAKMCYSRYRRLTNQSKDCWTKNQNQKLKALVEEYGVNSWKNLVVHFPNRNYKQLKDHYENYLRPNLETGQWSLQQDLQFIKLINQHGQNWKLIEKSMPWRSRNQLKNRFFGKIKRLNSQKLKKIEGDLSSSVNKVALFTK